MWFAVNQPNQAQMAELVDALGSGPNARKGVEVRVFFWAPVFLIHFYLLFFFDSFFGYLLWQQSRVSFLWKNKRIKFSGSLLPVQGRNAIQKRYCHCRTDRHS